MYQLCFYVPASHLELVKDALFAAGAGQYKGYDRCAWQILGQGQFRPLMGSNPFMGDKDQISTIPEYKVEMICVEDKINQALNALIASHPYEQPAFSIFRILNSDDCGSSLQPK